MEAKPQAKKATKGNNFLMQGSVLAVAGIIVRVIGLAYRIPLVNIVGREGMGYYSFAYSVYAVMLLLSSYSLPLAVSKMVSARMSKTAYVNVNRIFKAAIIYATAVGFIGCSITYFSADLFADVLFKTPYTAFALKTLAPTIWVMAYLGVFRGYYQGHSTMIPTAVSQIIEQVVNAAVSILAAQRLSQYAIDHQREASEVHSYGAAGGTIGTGAGALSALLLLILLYALYNRLYKYKAGLNAKTESYKEITKILVMTVIPVIASTAIYNINGIIDGAIFGNAMHILGRGAETAGDYGIYANEYMILINVPVAISNALSSSIIPVLSRYNASNDNERMQHTVGSAIRFSMLIAMPCAVGLTVLGRPLLSLLFKGADISIELMQVGASAVVLYSLSTLSNAILQGSSHMGVPVKNAVKALIIHVIILVLMLFVFKMGVYALVFANMVFAFAMCIFNALSIKKLLEYVQEIDRTFIKPAFAALIMGTATFGVYMLLTRFTQSLLIICPVCMLAAFITYFPALIALRTLEAQDLIRLPGGGRLVYLLERLKLM